MKRFFNDDVVLATNRTAVRISTEELREKIVQAAKNCPISNDYLPIDGNPNNRRIDVEWTKENITKYPNQYLECCVSSFFASDDEDTEFTKDMGISLFYPSANFDPTLRPWILKASEHSLLQILGLHTLENGLSFLGFTIADDDSGSFVAIAYWDGTKVRIYTPRWGNDVDGLNLCSWGQNYRHKKEYYAKYGFVPDDTIYDVDAIIQDIMTTIQVI